MRRTGQTAMLLIMLFAGRRADGAAITLVGSEEFRNWFSFDLSSVSGVTVAANLDVSTSDYLSPGGETYSLFDVSTPVASRGTDGSGLHAIFSNLVTSFGARTYVQGQYGSVLDCCVEQRPDCRVTKDPAAAQSRHCPPFRASREAAFTPTNEGVRQNREVAAVPEPGTLTLLSMALVAALTRSRHRIRSARQTL